MTHLKNKLISIRHRIKYDTRIGGLYIELATTIGLKLMSVARQCLKRGSGYCTICGKRNNMDQAVGKHGSRCMTSPEPCWNNTVMDKTKRGE